MKRIPEPELMDSEAQTQAYAGAEFSEPNQLFIDRFRSSFADLPVSGLGADLGCGPGDITLRLAQMLPGWRWHGIDAGPNMLKLAEQALAETPLSEQVELLCHRIPDPELGERGYQALVSNSLLHHLPAPDSLWITIRQMAAAGARVMVMDLIRPDSTELAQALVDQHAAGEPDILREDFYNSLCAAYTVNELKQQLTANQLDHFQLEMISDRHWMAWGSM